MTSGTYQKEPIFRGSSRLNFLTSALVALAKENGWRLQAWAVFPNHYHFVADSDRPSSLVKYLRALHSVSAKFVNELDDRPGRKVWHQYWDTHLTYHKSFMARLCYVHTNPTKHGLANNPELYEWCSAAWFARTCSSAFWSTVMSYPRRLQFLTLELARGSTTSVQSTKEKAGASSRTPKG